MAPQYFSMCNDVEFEEQESESRQFLLMWTYTHEESKRWETVIFVAELVKWLEWEIEDIRSPPRTWRKR